MSEAKADPLFDKTPPRPVLTLRVGISGHRPKPDVFPATNFAFVQKRLREVFAAIDRDLVKIAQARSALYADAAPRARLVSGLAEGADQMAVAAMPETWTLDAILPFPAEIYQDDFKTSAIDGNTDVTRDFRQNLEKAGTILALPDDLGPQTRDEAYARFGGFLLRQIDVLVAVWDGKPERGRGGTAVVVSAALAADIPVVWISAVADDDARMVESIERDGRVVAPDADCLRGPLTEAIESIVLLPEAGEAEDCAQTPEAGASARLQDFLRQPWPKPSRWLVYDLFKRAMEGKPPRWRIDTEPPEAYVARWRHLAEAGPAVGALKERLTGLLCPRFAWADALAVDYSHRYRSAYFTAYLLAACAVLIALTGIFGHGDAHDIEGLLAHKAVLVSCEALILLVILHLVRRGRSERWKEKWMEFRALAELLTNTRFLAYLGEHGRAQRLGNFEASSSAWFLWYLRATIREIGLPAAELDGAYQRAVLSAVDKHVIGEQKYWHVANSRTLNAMSRTLQTMGAFCFMATFCMLVAFLFGCLAYVAAGWSPEALPEREKLGAFLVEHKDWLTFFAAFLPAAGAALAGIRETGDFGKVAEHSTKTAAALSELQRKIARAEGELNLEETGDALLATARVLSADLAAWQSVYGHKRLDLPA